MNRPTLTVLLLVTLLSAGALVAAPAAPALPGTAAVADRGPAGAGPFDQTSNDLKRSRLFVVPGDYAVGGVGLRNRGKGTIDLDIPSGAEVVAAYLYFTVLNASELLQDPIFDYGIGTSNSQLAIISRDVSDIRVIKSTTDPVTLLGASLSPCWAPPNSYSYRVDITGLILPGSHSYQLDFTHSTSVVQLSGTTDGRDPWTSVSQSPQMDGASIVAIYRQEGLPLRQVLIYDGHSLSKGDARSVSMTVYNQTAGTTMRTTFIGADGQNPTAGPRSYFDGSNLGLDWEGASVGQNGADFSRGNLWDNLTAEGLPLDRNTAEATASLTPLVVNGYIDCVVWVAQVLSVDQVSNSTCTVPIWMGSDTNYRGSTGEPAFPDDGCSGTWGRFSFNRNVFYSGKLGSPKAAPTPWSCCVQGSRSGNCVDGREGEFSCDFDLARAREANRGGLRSYGYWYLSGPRSVACAGDTCDLTPQCDLDLVTYSAPGVAPEYQDLARFGACQADELIRQLDRYNQPARGLKPGFVRTDVLFADIEEGTGETDVWYLCTGDGETAECQRNRAVLLGFFDRARDLGRTPGVYTRSNYWRGRFEPASDLRRPWDPGIDFVLWVTGSGASCNADRNRAVTRFPFNTIVGGMRPVVWQYVESCLENPTTPYDDCEVECYNDYDVITQDPAAGLRPERAWYPGQTVFSRVED